MRVQVKHQPGFTVSAGGTPDNGISVESEPDDLSAMEDA
jgi:hypothetical protein